LKNENDIKIKITAGRMNENENYYKLKNENEKSCRLKWHKLHKLCTIFYGG